MSECNWPTCGCQRAHGAPWCKYVTVHPSPTSTVVQPSPALAALAMREQAALAVITSMPLMPFMITGINDVMKAIRALPATFTDAELLAAAMQLPEVRALVDALKMASIWLNYDGRYDMQGINAALAPFTKGGE